jgi:hypothetical protein
MASKIVIIIHSNPKESPRPCEGVRMALGLSACNHTVDLVLTAQAPLLLTDALEDCVDGALAKQYLTSLKNFITTFYIEENKARPALQSEYQTTVISYEQMLEKIFHADTVVTW